MVETIVLAARVASLACSSQEYTNKIQTILRQAFDDICESTNIDPNNVINISSSQDDITTISLSSSTTADIVCNYPAGSITVKNIPAQKGRPPKKNLPPKLQNTQPQRKIDLTVTKLPRQSELNSTCLQNQIESSSHLQNHPEFEPTHQHNQLYNSQVHFKSEQQSQETKNIRDELYQPHQSNIQFPFNSNELNSFLSQPQLQSMLQTNFHPHPYNQFQKQEQIYDSQSPQTNSFSQDLNQFLLSQKYPEMKIDPHSHFQNQPCERKQQIQTSQMHLPPQTREQSNFIKYALTQSLQEMFLRSYPQVFIPPQEENIRQVKHP